MNKFGQPQQLADGTSVAMDEAYVRESILMPQVRVAAGYTPLMPTFQGLLSEENVIALVEYVKTLKAPQGSASAAAAQENR